MNKQKVEALISKLGDKQCECVDVEIGSYDRQTSIRNWFTNTWVCVDTCLVKEVAELWHKKIVTRECCCGHNTTGGYIAVKKESISSMEALGYSHTGKGIFNLKPHPVRIGDVLEKIANLPTGAKYPKEICAENKKKDERMMKLLDLWGACFTDDERRGKTGLTKSLQEIAECGYNTCNPKDRCCDVCGTQDNSHHSAQCTDTTMERLKCPQARELFEFIATLNPSEG